MRPVKIDWKGNTFYRAAPIAGMSTVSSPQEQSLASVVIVDYGLGNLRSVTRGLERARVPTSKSPTIPRRSRPTTASSCRCRRVPRRASRTPTRSARTSPRWPTAAPLFGICLGMQMLLTTSEEGETDGESAVQGWI